MTADDRPPSSLAGYVPVPDERAAAYRAAGHWRGLTFHDVLDRTADAAPDRPAVVGPDPDRELTYGALARRSRRLAASLRALGVRPNERVAFQLPNCPEFLTAFLACSRVGAIPVTVLPRHREAEVRHVLGLTDATAYVTDAGRYGGGFDFVGLVEEVRDDFPHLDHCVAVTDGATPPGWHAFADLRDGTGDGSGIGDGSKTGHGSGTGDMSRTGDGSEGDAAGDTDAAEAVREADGVDPADPGVMLLSGGTTGMPKGIPRTHEDYVFQWERMAAVVGVEPDWVAFPSVPIGHNASLCCVVGSALWAGATVAVEPRLKPEPLMALVERFGGTYSLPIPTQIIDLLEHPAVDDYDLSSLEVLISGGQKVPPRVVYESVERWDVGFCNVFGMAEGPLVCTRPDDDVEVQAETVGRPIAPDADELRVVDRDPDSAVPAGEPGELAVRGPGFFTGYFRNEAENAEAFDDDGWFYTGDVLARREDGTYEVYGRITDTIVRGGENIYAPGVEDELAEHPAVANVAVVGMPDERLGERPCAFVELAEGAGSLALDDLVGFLDDRGVAVFKRPERLEVRDELPRTGVGKIDKAALEERIAGTVADEGDRKA